MEFEVRRLTDYTAVRDGIECWNRAHPDFSLPERVVTQSVFAPFDGLDVTVWGAVSDGSVVAVAVGKRLVETIPDYAGPEQGWISLFAVDPSVADRRAIADELLGTVERAATDRGVSRLRFGGDPGQVLPGAPTEFDSLRETLRDAGFESRETVHDLQRDIAEFDPGERVARVRESWPGLTVERAGADDADLRSFLADQFPGRWYYEARNVCRVPGGGTDYWLLRHDGTAVRFARTNAPDSTYRGANVNWADRLDGAVCGLGPLGVHESYRGRGWGLWMIASIVERYRDAGYDRTVIDWTGLLDYYRKLGFEPWLAYETFAKEVSS
ncbi:GNAT family N-acetyltransferase [Halorussus aquaticus]|uniref:GNAT family N-acetyltransferase n=1 Tax=Halorussus aquaticus TaxID=2953748 RepID=A0ABD5Q866_9EURY|nr:GNAT family N-acetyltransferase [Halorussus aquaticus]